MADQRITSKIETIVFTIDGGGSAFTTGSKIYREIQYNCVVSGWTLIADTTGSCVIDIKKCNGASFPTTSSIAGSEKPTLSSAQKNTDTNLTTWTRNLSDGDILEFYVDSVSGITKAQLFLKLRRS
mgnify:CR=1 FL=1